MEVNKKQTGPRGGEIFKNTPEERAAIKKAKSDHKKLMKAQEKKK